MNGNVPDDEIIVREKLVSSYLLSEFLKSRCGILPNGFSGINIDYAGKAGYFLLSIKQNYHFV